MFDGKETKLSLLTDKIVSALLDYDFDEFVDEEDMMIEVTEFLASFIEKYDISFEEEVEDYDLDLE